MRRVVVTGMGAVTPLANSVKHSWEKIIRGETGIDILKGFDTSDLLVKIGGEVACSQDPSITKESPIFNPDVFVDPRDQKMMYRFTLFGLGAVDEAVQQAGLQTLTADQKVRIGCMIGSGIGGLQQLYDTSVTLYTKGPRRVSPYFIVSTLINILSGFASIKYGFKGPNHSCVTACATATHAIGDAARMIMMDDADIMIAGGAEASLNRLGIAGFAACRALASDYNDAPDKASRPFDEKRQGFVMGEGAGVLVLEEYEHAKKRGVPILAEFIGYGLSGDAHHYTAPPESGEGAARAMKAALKKAKIAPEALDYINAHGTSTPLGDKAEINAVRHVMNDHTQHLAMSSTKSATGHLLGAAGGIEAVFTVSSLMTGLLPPTLNLDHPIEAYGIDLIAHKAQERPIRIAMSNSFGFGGTNASIIFKRFDE